MKIFKSEFLVIILILSALIVTAQNNKTAVSVPADIEKLLKAHTCFSCHNANTKLVGPSYIDVASKNYKEEQIVDLIYNPKPANWPGYPPMPPMKHVPKTEAMKIARWINSLNTKNKTANK